MPSSTTPALREPAEPLPRVVVERRIFVGDDLEVFLNEWVEPFDADYPYGRIEGYVLDLSGGRLWAAIDLSDISDAADRDIALRSVQPNDARARDVFLSLTRNCDPVTAVNVLTCAFDRNKWPLLAATCDAFTRRYDSVTSADVSDELLELERYQSPSISWEVIPRGILRPPMMPCSAGQHQHVYRCELANLPEQIAQGRSGRPTHIADNILEVRLNDETARFVERFNGSRLPAHLDRDDTIFLLTLMETLLHYRKKRALVQAIGNLRRQVLSFSNLVISG